MTRTHLSRPTPLLHLALAFALAAAAGCGGPAAAPAPPRILVDSIHAYNFLTPPHPTDAYEYHHLYGFRTGFAYLKSRGLDYDEVREGRLTPELLRGYRVLFINLVSADLPPFLASEIRAVRQFVEGGGSLLAMTDHTNCYYHAYKLAPLLEDLGIEVRLEMAADRPPHTIGAGNGWIAITRFAPHPVTAGLACVAFQSGGTVDDRFAVAFTSERGWGDFWQVHPFGEGDQPGFYGDWMQSHQERSGPLGTVLAKTVGKGRVVIVGDQNLFGEPFLNYADNWRLWINAAAWLAGMPELAAPEPYVAWRAPRILMYEEYPRAAWGASDHSGNFNPFAELGRHYWAFARHELAGRADVIVFAHDDYVLAAADVTALAVHLRAGRHVVILDGGVLAPERGGGVLEQLGPALGEPVRRVDGRRTTVTWPGVAGRVDLLLGRGGYTNRHWPSSTSRPSGAEQLRVDELVRAIRDALPPAGAAGAGRPATSPAR